MGKENVNDIQKTNEICYCLGDLGGIKALKKTLLILIVLF